MSTDAERANFEQCDARCYRWLNHEGDHGPGWAARLSHDRGADAETFFAVERPHIPGATVADLTAYELAIQRLRIAYGIHAGTVKPCPVASSLTDQPCTLYEGHPQDSPDRFHRYAVLSVPAPTLPALDVRTLLLGLGQRAGYQKAAEAMLRQYEREALRDAV